MIRTVSVFGSSAVKAGSPAYQEAYALGQALGRAHLTVATGGYGGTMDAVSRGVQEEGGKTIGVTCRQFQALPNRWLDEEIATQTFQERLFKLMEIGEAYIALPGGAGTLCEISVAWELIRKNLMPVKPLVFCGRFWEAMLTSLAEREGGGEWLHFVKDPKSTVEFLLRS